MSSGERDKILADLEPLFQKAIREKLWFRSNYQRIDFSPKELRKCHAKGEFVWGVVNWELIDPHSLLQSPEEAFNKIVKANNEINRRMMEGWNI